MMMFLMFWSILKLYSEKHENYSLEGQVMDLGRICSAGLG